MRELRNRRTRLLQGHTADERQNWVLKPVARGMYASPQAGFHDNSGWIRVRLCQVRFLTGTVSLYGWMIVGLAGWADEVLSCAAKGVAPCQAASLSHSACLLQHRTVLTILHIQPASWHRAVDPMRWRMWTCSGNTWATQMLAILISRTLLGLFPGASSTVWALMCQEML